MTNNTQCDSNMFIGSLNVKEINNLIKPNSGKENEFKHVAIARNIHLRNKLKCGAGRTGEEILFVHGSKHGKGTMILFMPNLDVEIKMVQTNPHGRYIVLERGQKIKLSHW